MPVFAFVAVLWCVLFAVSSHAWRFGNYYDYGWYVPPLALLLACRNWRELPDSTHGPVDAWNALPGPLLLLAPAWAAARVLTMADPVWRLPQWGLATITVGVTLWLVFKMKGRTGVLAFAPIAAFALTAVPMPVIAEQAIVQRLSHAVIEITALVFNFLGRPVQVAGNRMCSLGEWVEVADGCSGIRSLQGFLMVALFFGEWLKLRNPERLLLLGLSLGCIWLANVIRALGLAWLRFDHGEAAFSRWHDAAGILAFLAGSSVIWVLASALEPKHAPVRPQIGPACGTPVTRSGNLAAIGGVCLVLAIELAAWIWMHPPPRTPAPVLALRYPLPDMPARFDAAAFDKVRPALRCNEGWLAAVGNDTGRKKLRAGWFSWDNTDTGSVLEAFLHQPETCMGAIGWKLLAREPSLTHVWEGGDLAFDVTVFEDPDSGSPLYVFKTVWVDTPRDVDLRNGIEGLGSATKLRQLRLATVLQRFHPEHARVLMGVVAGENDQPSAWRRFQNEVLAGLFMQSPPDLPVKRQTVANGENPLSPRTS